MNTKLCRRKSRVATNSEVLVFVIDSFKVGCLNERLVNTPQPHVKEFLKALLLDRFEPPRYDPGALQKRAIALRPLFEALRKSPAGRDVTDLDEKKQKIIQEAEKGVEILFSRGDLELAQGCYSKAVEGLLDGLSLNRLDQKKWPSLNTEQKAVRVLTNYFYSAPERFRLEKPFREFGTLYHLRLAEQHLQTQNYVKAEEELGFAQEEIRHVLALSLGIDLIGIREEAETISQTTGQSERRVTISLFEKALDADLKNFGNIQTNLQSFLNRKDLSEGLLRLLPEHEFQFKQVEGLKNEKQLYEALREQYQNITLRLKPGAQIRWEEFFRLLLHLPDPFQHSYFRMPDVDCLLNVKIEDDQGKLLVFFDEQSRLVKAPSLSEIKDGTPDSDPEILDVAIIGGGPGGIAAGVNLTALGIYRYAIFERSEANSTVRDIWSREKEADTFYSGPPGPMEGLVGMQDTTRAVFLNRMQSFLDYFHLNLRNKEPVLKLHFDEAQTLWMLETPQGKYSARQVIMTAGRYGKPRLLKWEENNPPSELKNHVVRGVEVDDLENSTVLVVGGGNTAFDNVKTLIANGTGKKGNQVYLSYPKKPFNVPGSLHAHNNDQLLQWESEGKITILWNTNSESAEARNENGKTRWEIKFREGESPASIVVDYIAPAVGWQVDRELMEKVGLHFNEDNKNPAIDPQTGQAYRLKPDGSKEAIPGLFIAGDYAEQRSVPLAFTTNFRAALAISKILKNK